MCVHNFAQVDIDGACPCTDAGGGDTYTLTHTRISMYISIYPRVLIYIHTCIYLCICTDHHEITMCAGGQQLHNYIHRLRERRVYVCTHIYSSVYMYGSPCGQEDIDGAITRIDIKGAICVHPCIVDIHTYVHLYTTHIHSSVYTHMSPCIIDIHTYIVGTHTYGVALVSKIDKIISLFCKRAL